MSDHIDDLGVQHVAAQQELVVLQRDAVAVDGEGVDGSHVPELDTGVNGNRKLTSWWQVKIDHPSGV